MIFGMEANFTHRITPNEYGTALYMFSPIFEPPLPLTDQTERARGLKFCMASPHDSLLRVIEAIFDKSPPSGDMEVGWGTLGGPKITKIFYRIFQSFIAIFG